MSSEEWANWSWENPSEYDIKWQYNLRSNCLQIRITEKDSKGKIRGTLLEVPGEYLADHANTYYPGEYLPVIRVDSRSVIQDLYDQIEELQERVIHLRGKIELDD